MYEVSSDLCYFYYIYSIYIIYNINCFSKRIFAMHYDLIQVRYICTDLYLFISVPDTIFEGSFCVLINYRLSPEIMIFLFLYSYSYRLI